MLYLFIALPLSLLRVINTGFLGIMYVQIAIGICLCALFVNKKKINVNTKAILLCAIFFILGTSSIHAFGLSSVGLFFFFACSMVARISAGRKPAIFVSVLGTIVGLLYFLLMRFVDYSFSVPQSDYNQSALVWLISLSLYLYLNSTCLYVVEKLIILLEKRNRIQVKAIDAQQDQLSFSSSILSHVINNLPFSIIWKDTSLVIQGANKRFLEEHNATTISTLQSETDCELFGASEAGSRYEIEHALLNKQYQRYNYQTQYKNADDEIIHKEIRHILMRDANNKPIGILITESDITKYIELKETNDLGLTEKEKLQSTKSRFLANVSHEIRTPLNGIQGMLQLIQATSISDEQNKYLQSIESSVFMLDQILSDLLDISNIEAGELRIEKAPFEVDKIIRGLVTVFQDKATKKGIKWVVEVDNRVNQTLIGDPKRLLQILYNLLSNAIKFTQCGEVQLIITIKPKDKAALATFFVSDTGIGFEIDKINHLFSSFTQNENHRTRRFGGNGLGLPIIKNLVDMMNGQIQVSSELDKGSQFIVTMPFTISKRKSDLNPNRENEKLRILLVEDNEINQEIALGMLDKNNFDITVANNGKIAVEFLQTNKYDIVLMDIQMPVMDGVTAATEIRKTYSAEQLPIVAVTANVMESDIKHYLKIGFSSHVGKPYNKSVLLNAVREIVANNIDRRTANYF